MAKFPYDEGQQEKCWTCGRRYPVVRMRKKEGGWRCKDCFDPTPSTILPKYMHGSGSQILKITRPGTD
jgi:hypothetical protein